MVNIVISELVFSCTDGVSSYIGSLSAIVKVHYDYEWFREVMGMI